MNPDLEFRLSTISNASVENSKFFADIVRNLCALTDKTVILQYDHIENDEDDSAYVTREAEVFIIVLDSRMPYGMIIDLLIHELAHVDSWHLEEEDDHGLGWGVTYAHYYRKYLKIYEGLL